MSDRSASVRLDNSCRDFGPITPKTAMAEVRSTISARAPAGMFVRMWSLSRSVLAAPLTMRNSVTPVRVMVTSAS